MKAITVECWLRPFLSEEPGGIVTQFDYPEMCGFGLFMNPGYRVVFYLGDGENYQSQLLHISPENTLKRGAWHHIVATWDGKEKTVWVNGKRIAVWP